MATYEQAANLGHRENLRRLSELLDAPLGSILQLDQVQLAQLRQSVAALLSRETWIDGMSEQILTGIDTMLATGVKGTNRGQVVVTRAENCYRFTLQGFSQPAYLLPMSMGREQPTGPFAEALELMNLVSHAPVMLQTLGAVIVSDRQGGPNHRSYTLSLLGGTVFTEPTDSPIHAFEVLVHETAHSIFNNVLVGTRTDDQVRRSTAKVYSPWRKEMRPLAGFLHGAFAFAMVRDALLQVSRHPDVGKLERAIAERRAADEGVRMQAVSATVGECARSIPDAQALVSVLLDAIAVD